MVRSSGGSGGGSSFGIPRAPYPLPRPGRSPHVPMESVSVDLSVPGVALVSLTGEHELYDALTLRESLTSQLESGRSLVVDLTETVFIDSSIVGVLLDAKGLAAE